MFMFRKKKIQKNVTGKFQREASKFQAAVAEVNSKYKPADINYSLIEEVAKKHGVDVKFVAGSFETFLKRNAISAIRKLKSSDDYTVLNLEQTAETYGFDLDSLGVTYFSQE